MRPKGGLEQHAMIIAAPFMTTSDFRDAPCLPFLPCRVISHQLVGALRVSMGGRNSAQLSSDYEEFFLNNADDISALLKKLPKSPSAAPCTHFQAQQMMCTMFQVIICSEHTRYEMSTL